MPVTDKNIVVVLCADNGIVEEGISQSDQSVTAVCAENIAKGRLDCWHNGGFYRSRCGSGRYRDQFKRTV